VPGREHIQGVSSSTQEARGERAEFTAMFAQHVEAVWNHAYRLTGSWSKAEDLASATFLTAWRRRADIRTVDGSVLPWLYTVVANLARNEYRSSTRFLRAIRRLPLNHTVDDHADAVADRLDDDQRLRVVLRAVQKLPRAEREAVELCLLGELSVPAAAELLGVAEASMRSRISRARARLRTLVEDNRD
jgi:RNA polymerase sigma-70 factor (ECF subfamily)